MKLNAYAYRPWRGRLRSPAWRFWPVARSGLALIFKRKIFWFFLFIGLLNFLFYFAVIYTLTQLKADFARQGRQMPEFVQRFLFTESGDSYRQFIFAQNIVLMLMLAFSGAILIGNDFRFHAVAFYLSKPITRLHYFLGKLLAITALAALVTLLPALALFIEYGMFTDSLDYWMDHSRVLFAILGYGALVSLAPAVVLMGVSAWCRRTIPIIAAWAGLFLFLPYVGNTLRNFFHKTGGGDPWGWSLLDFWADLRWISSVLFGAQLDRYEERWPWAALVVGAWMALAVWVFWQRIGKTEVVS